MGPCARVTHCQLTQDGRSLRRAQAHLGTECVVAWEGPEERPPAHGWRTHFQAWSDSPARSPGVQGVALRMAVKEEGGWGRYWLLLDSFLQALVSEQLAGR